MAWGFWSASTVSDRGRSPRRATTATSSAIYYQPQQQAPQQQQQQAQCNVTVNQCMQPEEVNIPIPVQQQQRQGPNPSVCGSPCQSVCHTPTCISPSCHSGTTGEWTANRASCSEKFKRFFLLQNHPNLNNARTNNVKSPSVNTTCSSRLCNTNNCSRPKCIRFISIR